MNIEKIMLMIEIFSLFILSEIIRKNTFMLPRIIFFSLLFFPIIFIFEMSNLFVYIIGFIIVFLTTYLIDNKIVKSLNITFLSLLTLFIMKHLTQLIIVSYLPMENIFVVYSTLLLLFCVLIASFFRNTISSRLLNSVDNYYQSILSVFQFATLLIFMIIFIIPAVSNEKIELNGEALFLLFISYAALGLVLIASLYNHSQNVKKQDKQELENKFLYEYLRNLENYQKQIRSFRHDYNNILLSLEYFLKNNDFIGLKTFYYDELKKTPLSFTQPLSIEGLSNIKIKEIQGLLVAKFNYMISRDIPFSFSCTEEVVNVNCKTISLIRILGIVLDNAIEEILAIQTGKISISMYLENRCLNVHIINDCRPNIEPIYELKKQGFSTKMNGHGLGLSNLEEIKNSEKHILIETKHNQSIFSQKIVVLGD